MVPKFRLVVLVLLIISAFCFSASPLQARSIRVTINDPGCRCEEEGATNVSNICTHDPAISLTGWAGVEVISIGAALRSADLVHCPGLRAGRISVNVTQAATQAVLEGTVDIDGDLSGCMIDINGLDISGGRNAAATIANINAHTNVIGVIASLSATRHLVLTTTRYGSAARIAVVQALQVLGTNTAAAVGSDAEAEVTYEDGSPVSDDVWHEKYDGCSIGDMAGDAISLTDDAIAHAGDKGPQIEVSFDDVTEVEWHNLTNGTRGQCTGTVVWQADDIPLAFGENVVVVAAATSGGESGFFPISIDRYDHGSSDGVAILSPTDQWDYTTHSSTVDLAGVCGYRDTPAIIAAPAIPAVVRCSFPQTQLQENDQLSINLIRPARRATLTGTIRYDEAQGGVITVNGVEMIIEPGIAGVVKAFDRYVSSTGVGLQRPIGDRPVLESRFCGSISRIEVSNAACVLGFDSASVAGSDAIAEVTDVSGAPVTDGIWDCGTGAMLRDSYGNSITLDETAAASAENLGVALVTQYSPSSVLTWQNSAAQASGTCNGVANWSAAGIPLVPGQNTLQVTADDGSGNTINSSLWVTYFEPHMSIAEVGRQSSSYASLKDIVVTAGSGEVDSAFYAADSERTAGVQVYGLNANRGEKLTVDGIVWPVDDGYRMLAYAASDRSSGSFQPFAISNRALSTLGGDIHLGNLLVRTWGKAKLRWDGRITVDDGSGAPVICQLPASVTFDPAWRYISVTGIVSSFGIQPLIMARDADDVVAF